MTIQELLQLNILKLFGLDNLSQEEQKKFLEYAAGLVLNRVVAQVAKELPPEKKEEFFGLFQERTSEEAKTAFLKEHAPDLEAITLEEILKFKDEALKIAGELTNNKRPTTDD